MKGSEQEQCQPLTLMFFKEVIESYIVLKLMLCCEVSKIADMIVATTLPDHLHFYYIYLIKARVTTKEKV